MTFHDSKRLTRQISRLLQRVNYERQTDVGPRNFKLQTMLDLMHLLEHPHLAAPVIHIAGTKGKGSVSKMVGEILSHAGYRTGIYSSPHLERINQRIAVDGRLIEDGQFSRIPVLCRSTMRRRRPRSRAGRKAGFDQRLPAHSLCDHQH